jgi:hypothetical protein
MILIAYNSILSCTLHLHTFSSDLISHKCHSTPCILLMITGRLRFADENVTYGSHIYSM